MKKALIGYTGFVGSNLQAQMKFDDLYNSKNIQDIKDKEYDVVYCAGAPAAKWIANQKPTEDLQSVCSLIDAIREVKTKRFVLISTVDVYKSIIDVDENSFIDLSNHHAYGTHRRIIETFVSERFENYNIIRLPGLFGDGLKKNIIYDFLYNNETNKIHSEAVFQFYSLDTLANDIQKVIDANINLINFATEPTIVKEVIKAGFDIDFDNKPTPNAPFYDMHTKYAEVFGESGNYIQSKKDVLQKVKEFVQIFINKHYTFKVDEKKIMNMMTVRYFLALGVAFIFYAGNIWMLNQLVELPFYVAVFIALFLSFIFNYFLYKNFVFI